MGEDAHHITFPVIAHLACVDMSLRIEPSKCSVQLCLRRSLNLANVTVTFVVDQLEPDKCSVRPWGPTGESWSDSRCEHRLPHQPEEEGERAHPGINECYPVRERPFVVDQLEPSRVSLQPFLATSSNLTSSAVLGQASQIDSLY